MCLYIRKSENIDIYFMVPFSINPIKYSGNYIQVHHAVTLKNLVLSPKCVLISYDSQNKN
jgi:hypothetical protein